MKILHNREAIKKDYSHFQERDARLGSDILFHKKKSGHKYSTDQTRMQKFSSGSFNHCDDDDDDDDDDEYRQS